LLFLTVLVLTAASCGRSDDPLPEASPAQTSDESATTSELADPDNTGETEPSTDQDETPTAAPDIADSAFGPAPSSPNGPLDADLEADLDTLFDSLAIDPDLDAIDRIGASVTLGGVTVTSDGAGFTATSETTGDALAAHQAFWFAWSQFHTDTLLFGS